MRAVVFILMPKDSTYLEKFTQIRSIYGPSVTEFIEGTSLLLGMFSGVHYFCETQNAILYLFIYPFIYLPYLFIYTFSFFSFFCCSGAVLASSFWLVNWTRLSWQDQQDPYNVYVYISLAGGSLLSALCRSFLSFHGLINSSSNLHMEMLTSLLTAPIRFFDVNPAGRILNRFANDIGCMDEVLPYSLLETVHYFVLIISILVLVSVANLWVIGACVPFAFLSLYCSRRQIKAAREIKRIEAITSSTVCAHVADTILGITTVRVYKRQKEFLDSFYRFVISLLVFISSIRKYQPKGLMEVDTL